MAAAPPTKLPTLTMIRARAMVTETKIRMVFP